MNISYEKTRYHRFTFSYSYTQERVDFCRTLRDSFGWKEFSFDAQGTLKRWVFSHSFLVPVIQERFPEVVIEPQVEDIVRHEQHWTNEQKKKEQKIDEVRQKKDTSFHVKGLKKELYSYQKVGVEFLVASGGRAIVADQMGCISGDAIVQVLRAGVGRKMTLRDLSNKFNHITGRWDTTVDVKVRALKGVMFGQQKVIKIIAKGVKPVVEVTTKTKKSLVLTPDHEVLTVSGQWKPIGDLHPGEKIIVNGKKIVRAWCNVCNKETEIAASEYNGGTVVFIPKEDEIVSIKDAGEIDVYDLVMEDPHRNFVANGIVVHNCGKTIQAIAHSKHAGHKRVLIVCPASVKFAWEAEIKKWTNLSSVIIDSKTDLAKIDADVMFWVCNYDILKKHYSQLAKIHFDCIVGDECQMIKTPGAIRTKAFRQISRNIQSIILLSGTPLLSRPSELYSLLNIIDPKTWNNWYDFARRYCALKQTRWGLDSSGASNIEELHNRIRRYFIRRDKTEVLSELPPKNFIPVPVQLANNVWKEYDAAADDLATYLRLYSGSQPPEIARAMAAEKLTQLNILRQINALGKIDTAIELTESILNAEEKVLVFCSFIEPLEKLKEHFGDTAVMLTGKTPVEERKDIVGAFQNDKNVQVFLGGIKSAGIGITLTAASNVIFLDYSWNPADHQQAQDRVHRPGQAAQSVNIYQLVAKNTIDEDLKEILDHKQGIFDQVIDGKVGDRVVTEAMDAAVSRVLNEHPA